MKKIVICLLTLNMTLFADIVVIANKNVPNMDVKTIAKIFTGKIIQVNSTAITPVNLLQNDLKNKFLQKFVGMSYEQYSAYWTVRQYIGKGTAPRDLSPVAAMIAYIKQTPGAIGYINDTDLVDGVNIIARK
ncbi:MAG: hypothetical protein WCW84_09390 [Sulfurimonas sp.]